MTFSRKGPNAQKARAVLPELGAKRRSSSRDSSSQCARSCPETGSDAGPRARKV